MSDGRPDVTRRFGKFLHCTKIRCPGIRKERITLRYLAHEQARPVPRNMNVLWNSSRRGIHKSCSSRDRAAIIRLFRRAVSLRQENETYSAGNALVEGGTVLAINFYESLRRRGSRPQGWSIFSSFHSYSFSFYYWLHVTWSFAVASFPRIVFASFDFILLWKCCMFPSKSFTFGDVHSSPCFL